MLVHFHCWCSCAEFHFFWNRSLYISSIDYLLTWPQKPAHYSVWSFFPIISAVVQIPILPRVRLAWLKSEVFLVLYYTPRLTITVRGLVVACTTGSISNPYNPTYWARLQSPVNYQTGVSFCPSSTNPLSAPLSYWAVVLSRDLALFLHRHHMTEVLVEILTGYFPHFVDFLDPWSPFVTCSSGPLAPCMVQPPVIVAIHLSAPLSYWAVVCPET